MTAFRTGRLRIRRDLHLGVGFLAATAPADGDGRLCLRHVDTAAGTLSTIEAGTGDAVVLLHGLGATKASFLPTIDALSRSHRAIAVDLPGFGDSTSSSSAATCPSSSARARPTRRWRASWPRAARGLTGRNRTGPDGAGRRP